MKWRWFETASIPVPACSLKVCSKGIRISDRDKSVAFYKLPGFELVVDGGYDQGNPLVMVHPSGINLNMVGPATAGQGANILMDEKLKYPGITHVTIKMTSAQDAAAFVIANNIAITGQRDSENTETIFIRDPDRNVLELVGPGPSVSTLIAEKIHQAEN